ncbi:MAG: winged helix-turn-helix domain-containing protein, partial [Acidobacteria bacterium]|nr:winged helix-turn-helix domain-containing protein [Acidobacteriota bacterium]
MHVEARSMQVLLCLVRHAPELVTREALLEEVWSDTPYVSDEVLSHAVWELRKALGDSARDPRFIRTVPRKGYQLVAPIDDPAGVPEPTEGARIQHFELLEEIGRGAMGVVYRARDRRLDRVVAVKFLAPELTRDEAASRRFLREARLAASLEHPNLAT